MTGLLITGFYAALLIILLLALTINIIRLRFKYRVPLGDGGQVGLTKAIRVHGNFIEYIPLALILMAIFELNHGSEFWLHAAGISLVVGRLSHAFALYKTIGTSIYRQIGMFSVFFVYLGFAIANINNFLA